MLFRLIASYYHLFLFLLLLLSILETFVVSFYSCCYRLGHLALETLSVAAVTVVVIVTVVVVVAVTVTVRATRQHTVRRRSFLAGEEVPALAQHGRQRGGVDGGGQLSRRRRRVPPLLQLMERKLHILGDES